jgi:hypothetical protein
MPKPKTGAQREAKRRAQGRAIACVLRDPAALTALAALEAKHGGVTAAISAALIQAHGRHSM